MAKIARTPFNASRWVTKRVSSNTNLSIKQTGQCVFVTASSQVDLSINFLDKGSYFKIIVREDTTAAININLPALEGVLIYDTGSGVGFTNAGDSGQTILTIPATASAGTYVDLICDGLKWYVTGMAHGVQWTQS
jgi:hypothetical protein